MASYNYSGNDDFRGYVAANVAYAKNPTGLLSVIGNDGKIDWGKASKGVDLPTLSYGAGNAQKIQDYVSDLYGKYSSAKQSDAYNSSLAAILAATKANQAPIPRMVNYDITGSWNKAREMATNAVSPIYAQKMTDFLGRQQQELGRQQADTTTGKSALDEALSRFLADSATQRTRTTEDANTDIKDINETQAYNARTEGLSFDEANRSLNEGLGASGTAESGLGAQAVSEAQGARTMASNEQVRQSENKVTATKTLMNRTFEDLTTGETRKTNDTTSGKQKLDLDLERFIEDQAFDRDQETKNEELQKQADISSQSINYQSQLVDQWIASLAGQGYTAQEVANAASIYK